MTSDIKNNKAGETSAQDTGDEGAGISVDQTSGRAHLVLPNWIEDDLTAPLSPSSKWDDNKRFGNAKGDPVYDKTMQDLLTLSRIGRLEPVENINISEALDEVLRKQPLPDGFTLTRDFEYTEIATGAGDLFTLLSVLLTNAVTHHDRLTGHIWITTRAGEDFVSLSVKDDGPGIPPRYLERVFEMMSTLTPKEDAKGNGMGLPIGRKIVSHYGGSIRAISEENMRGTEITASFPSKL